MMNANTVTNLPEKEFLLPDAVEGSEFSNEDIADDMQGMRLRFQRVKIPSGGNLQFELPGDDPDDPRYERYIEGVILHSHNANAYWESGENDEENTAPDCSSSDGITGVGDPGGSCGACAFNQYGTAENGRGKACKNMRYLFILQNGDFMPILLALSPTSLKPYNDFFSTAFAFRRRGTCGSVVQIGLKRMNNGKDDYSVATFRRLYDFSGEPLRQIKAYAHGFKEQLKNLQSGQTASEQGAEPPDEALTTAGPIAQPEDEVEDLPFWPPANSGNEAFSVSSTDARFVIDGEREDMPA